MNYKESDLPGIGKKFVLQTRSGDKVVVIVHDDGRRELYHFEYEDPDHSISMVTLDDDEARFLSAIVGGVTYKPRALESIEVALDDLVIEWYRLEPGYRCVGLTIGELDIRARSGATVIAVIDKNHNKHINPGPELTLQADSMVVAAGEREQHKQLKEILRNGCG
ncbi:cation:proton antiporter regulatory subunit [Paenibacillus sp. HN-1]|uniref:cation:proton antiporter regulatory subunit n=1 Tax=Paenibacillus TaxID=44249 RepID=UPI001CA8AA8C|nr:MULTISPECIES: cation:proton antiporter regulatory subunit [Paenibacillus]MBY9082269.1 cation:proton antiporter regulatory subunit [Paenibacillus sp. CGMCC 1.18879]MBY9086367.1 cation:proton antiporter regulatory subunit [Paenibacillus sinensis]